MATTTKKRKKEKSEQFQRPTETCVVEETVEREADNTASRISVPFIDCGLTLTIVQLITGQYALYAVLWCSLTLLFSIYKCFCERVCVYVHCTAFSVARCTVLMYKINDSFTLLSVLTMCDTVQKDHFSHTLLAKMTTIIACSLAV